MNMRTNSARSVVLSLLASAALVGATQQAGAYLLAYEGFDYAPGVDLSGANGGFGWTTPWGVNSAGTTIFGSVPGDVAAPGSLLYVDSADRMLFNTGGHGFYSGQPGTSSPFRDFVGTGGVEGSTVWFSVLLQRSGSMTNNTGTPFNPYPRGANVSLFDAGSERLAIGAPSGAVSNTLSLIPSGSGGNRVASDADYSLVNLAVVRIDYGAEDNDTAYLFVNPALGTEPALASAAAVTNNFNFNFARVRPFAGADDLGNGRPYAELLVDEIRVGTTWQDVTPFITIVPEPSALSLLGLGGLVAWAMSRRRK